MEWYDQDERFNPTLRRSVPPERGWLIDNPLPEFVWAYMEDGMLASIPDEYTAALLAEEFPFTICFFADAVNHPNS